MQKKPRNVTKEDIEAFEKQYPAYGHIGKVMLEAGIWRLVESKNEQNDKTCGSRHQFDFHSTLSPTANIRLSDKNIKLPLSAEVTN